MNTSYFELTVIPSHSYDLFIDFINEIFPDSIEEDGGAIILRAQEPLEDLAWAIEAYAQALGQTLGINVVVTCTMEQKDAQDWIATYQQSVQPVEVGEFYIHPSWSASRPDKLNVLIDPALAFGSGHHPTTATCLEAISRYVHADDKVVDVGCGSGILGIASAKKHAVVDVCDTDEEAMLHTRENFEKNQVQWRHAWQGSIHMAREQYDVIIANIVADVLGMIASDVFKALRDGGIVILSGILDKYEDKVLKSYKKFHLTARIVQEEWVTLIMKK